MVFSFSENPGFEFLIREWDRDYEEAEDYME